MVEAFHLGRPAPPDTGFERKCPWLAVVIVMLCVIVINGILDRLHIVSEVKQRCLLMQSNHKEY